jgi:hypothetical protein
MLLYQKMTCAQFGYKRIIDLSCTVLRRESHCTSNSE